MAKKAKDWALMMNEAGPVATMEKRGLVSLLEEFIGEIGDVAKARGGTLNAMEGAVREQRSKFEAVVRLCPKLAGQSFNRLLEEYGMEFCKAEQKYRSQVDHKKQTPQSSENQERGDCRKPKDKALSDSQRRRPGGAPSKHPGKYVS